MRKLFVIIICIVLFGCNSPKRVVNDASFIKRSGEGKSMVSERFFSNHSLKPISTLNGQDFYTMNEWYDENTVIYSVGENELSSLYLHNIFSGKRALFYQTEEFVGKVQANSDHTLFAVQTMEQSGISHLRILNKFGNEVFSWSNNIEELQFMWNPYNPDELIITEFLTSLEFKLLKVTVSTEKVEKLPVNNPFVQWIGKDEIGYLNWNQNEPSLEAPLVVFNIHTNEEKEWLKNCILLFSLKNLMIAVSIDKNNLNKTLYTFYDTKTRKKLTKVFIPVLNTFSEAWWIPSFDYDDKNKLFYFIKPSHAGDVTEYNDGYQLSILSIEDRKEEILASFPDNLPLKLSPDGQWCLIGQQLENVINTANKEITSLVSN